MMPTISDKILKRRAAVERWKAKNRDHYLDQKRRCSARPEYRAKMRARYHCQQEELREAGIIPRKQGRPRLYDGEEALEVNKIRAREASARYRSKRLSHVEENYESEKNDSTASESSP